MFCTNCGKQMNDGAAFCTECGAPTGVQPAQAKPLYQQSAAVTMPAAPAQPAQPAQTTPLYRQSTAITMPAAPAQPAQPAANELPVNRIGIIGLVISIISHLPPPRILSLIPLPYMRYISIAVGLVLGLAGLVVSVVALVKRKQFSKNGFAIAGVVIGALCIISTVLSFLLVILEMWLIDNGYLFLGGQGLLG